MFWSNWQALEKILLSGVIVYSGLVLMLRTSGKRTLSRMNAFDLVVTVAFGSTLSSAILSQNTKIVDGLATLFLLILLQLVVALLSGKFRVIRKFVKAEPRFLYKDGLFLKAAMRKERILEEEVFQMARSRGMGSMKEIAAVVLETNGRLSIIKLSDYSDGSTMKNVKGENYGYGS